MPVISPLSRLAPAELIQSTAGSHTPAAVPSASPPVRLVDYFWHDNTDPPPDDRRQPMVYEPVRQPAPVPQGTVTPAETRVVAVPGEPAVDVPVHHDIAEDGLAAPLNLPKPPAPSSGPRIIVADDDATVRTLVRRVLTTELGAEVVEASDGLEVLEALKSAEFDLAILDIDMDVLDGVETLQAIRTTQMCRNLPVIVISGHADEENIARLKPWNIRALLAKPLTLAVLRGRLLPLVRQIVETPPVHQAPPHGRRFWARSSSRVFVVDAGGVYSEFLRASLGGCYALSIFKNESAAVRAAVGTPPDIIFLAPSDPLVSPATFERALRHELKIEPRIILCKQAEAHRHDDDAAFSRLEDLTPEALMRVLHLHLTDAGLSLAALQIVCAPALREWSRARVASTLSRRVRIGDIPQDWARGDETGIEVSAPIVVDGQQWRLTMMVTRALAVRDAAVRTPCDDDAVSEDLAVRAVQALAAEAAAQLEESWRAHQIASRVGPGEARSIRWWDTRVAREGRGTIAWALTAGTDNLAAAAFSVAVETKT